MPLPTNPPPPSPPPPHLGIHGVFPLIHLHLLQLLLQRLHRLLQLVVLSLQLLHALGYAADVCLGRLHLGLGDLSLDHLSAHPTTEGLLSATRHRTCGGGGGGGRGSVKSRHSVLRAGMVSRSGPGVSRVRVITDRSLARLGTGRVVLHENR